MHLVQILLPLYDNDNRALPRSRFERVRRELTERFGGATLYTRAPAEGTWKNDAGYVQHDDVVVVEVMVDALERDWWSRYRDKLSRRFRQQEIVARAMPIESL
ncbi:MAG: hypothetical protein IT531_18490 [Burkholderiales bacterium]|nr:hypothetical protein [Burkholderiales bacterium]